MKKVLIISYYWPPSGGSGVQRWVKMCKYLPQFGWTPVVYTPDGAAVTSTDTSLLQDISPDLEVIRRPILEPGQFTRKSVAKQVTPINSGEKSLGQRLALWIRGNVFIPDPRVVWVEGSVLFLRKWLKENPVDAIVTTGPPHSMHLIGRNLASRLDIPWIADFRDPWTRMFYFKYLRLTRHSRRRHINMEASVLEAADRIVAVSPLVQEEFRAMTSTEVELITNGFDEDDFALYPENAGQGDKFILLHAGLFASGGNPLALWEALHETVETDPEFARRLSLRLCGKTDTEIIESIFAFGLEDYLDNMGYLPHNEVVEQMKNASVLMLPLRREPEYRATLPGKLFEYLAARRPILGIGPRDGAMASVIRASSAGCTFDWEEKEQIKEWIADAFKKYLAGELSSNRADLSAYSRKPLAGRYAALLDEVKSEHIKY